VVATLPLERIERAVRPDGAQRSALKELQDASGTSKRSVSTGSAPLRADAAKSPTAGARTRSGKPCRSPATKKGRCRLNGGAKGSGGPPGERNGQYRHGEGTKAAIA